MRFKSENNVFKVLRWSVDGASNRLWQEKRKEKSKWQRIHSPLQILLELFSSACVSFLSILYQIKGFSTYMFLGVSDGKLLIRVQREATSTWMSSQSYFVGTKFS